MANKLAALKALAAENAEVSVNMNEVVAGGGKKLPCNRAIKARLVQVIECGDQPQTYMGQEKDPAPEIILGFELWDKELMDEKGRPYLWRTRRIKVSQNEKANARKIFMALNYKGEADSFGQLLDETFLLFWKEVDSKKKPGTKVTVWDSDKIFPPRNLMDPTELVPVPEGLDDDYMVFFWNKPTMECFESLKIEGTFTDAKGNVKSKNWIQELLLSATNFVGSPLDQLLQGAGFEMPDLSARADAGAEGEDGEDAGDDGKAAAAPAAPAKARRTPPTIAKLAVPDEAD